MNTAEEKCNKCGKFKKSVANQDNEQSPRSVTGSKSKKQKLTCYLCQKQFVQKCSMIRHLRTSHPLETGGSAVKETLYKCEVENCPFQTRHANNLKRHKIKIHENAKSKVVDKKYFNCSLCNKKFGALRNLRFHERKAHQVGDLVITIKRQCPICSFVSTEHDKKEMLSHFENVHEIAILWENIQLNSIGDFVAWKKDIEKLTTSSFVRTYSTPTLVSFQCHRSGIYKKKGLDKRRLKLQGSCKINGFCPAAINVKVLENSTVEVSYLPTHVGHKNEIEHIRLPPDENNKNHPKKRKSSPRVKSKKICTPQLNPDTQIEMTKLMIEVQEEMEDCTPQTIFIEHVADVPADVGECLTLQQSTVENCQITVLTALPPSSVENLIDLQVEKNKFLEDFFSCINESVQSMEDLEYVRQHCQAILPSLPGPEHHQ